MCVGGFADAVRRQAKRGRPKKNRPELEQRVDKATKTRRALASVASSVAASSPPSEAGSPPQYDNTMHAQSLPQMLPETASFNDSMGASTDPFRYEFPTIW
jgi:regulatory protein SWI5